MFGLLKKTLIYFSLLALIAPVTAVGKATQSASSPVSVSAVTVTVDTNPQTGKISLSSHVNSNACQFEVQNTLSLIQDESVVNLHQGLVCEPVIAVAPVATQADLAVSQPVNKQSVKVVVHRAELDTVKVRTSSQQVSVAVLPAQISGIEIALANQPVLGLARAKTVTLSQSFNYILSFNRFHILLC